MKNAYFVLQTSITAIGTQNVRTSCYLFDALEQGCTIFFGQVGRNLQWMNSGLHDTVLETLKTII